MKIVLQHLTKQFPSRNKKSGEVVTAVDDFNFEIPDGKLIGLLGPSGCGKSTALNLISGLIRPTSGKIFFGDDDVTNLPPENRGVGLVFQSYALYPHLTAKQNILFPLQNLKGADRLSREEMERRVQQAARLVQIERLMERKPGEMSGGQQQRVAIARAIVKMPRVLLLDEPLSNLDARLRLQTREEIRRIQRDTGITTVFVTHDQEEAMSISDMIVVMKEGAVQQIGKPQDVYDDPVNLFVAKFLGTPPINVFEGRVEGGALFIGPEGVMDAPGARDGGVWAGVRPEGFVLDGAGPLGCELSGVEVMGRDISVVCRHPANAGTQIRAIISSENRVDPDSRRVRFALKPHKVFLFDREGEERIRVEEAQCARASGEKASGEAGLRGQAQDAPETRDRAERQARGEKASGRAGLSGQHNGCAAAKPAVGRQAQSRGEKASGEAGLRGQAQREAQDAPETRDRAERQARGVEEVK